MLKSKNIVIVNSWRPILIHIDRAMGLVIVLNKLSYEVIVYGMFRKKNHMVRLKPTGGFITYKIFREHNLLLRYISENCMNFTLFLVKFDGRWKWDDIHMISYWYTIAENSYK